MEYYPLLRWEKSSDPPDDENVARIASRYYTTDQRSPRNMTENYPHLANRLTSQTEFTQEEWDDLGIKDMKLLDYICADKFYFQPSPPSGSMIAVRWDQQQDNSKKFDEPPNQVNLSAEHVRGLHVEVQARDQVSNERMRLGGIVFSWEEGQHLKRVPYFIVPDGWAKESSFVDMVIQGMKLKTPNMVLCAIHVRRTEPHACAGCTRGTHAQMAHTHTGSQLQPDQGANQSLEQGMGLLLRGQDLSGASMSNAYQMCPPCKRIFSTYCIYTPPTQVQTLHPGP